MESTDQSTQQQMFSLIETWKESGQSQIAFCKEKDIAYHRFHYWLKKYNDQNEMPPRASSFLQVKVPPPNFTDGSIEVIYPDGRKVVFHQAVEVSFLRNLLA